MHLLKTIHWLRIVAASLLMLSLTAHADRLSIVKNGASTQPVELFGSKGNAIVAGGPSSQAQVIVLFASWCPSCKKLLKAYASDNIVRDNPDVLWAFVGQNETKDSLKQYAHEQNIDFEMYADPDGSFFQQYALDGIPRVYVLDRKGRIIYQGSGLIDSGFERIERHIKYAKVR